MNMFFKFQALLLLPSSLIQQVCAADTTKPSDKGFLSTHYRTGTVLGTGCRGE